MQLNCAKVMPISEALDVEKKMKMIKNYLMICQLTTVLTLSDNNIHTDHLKVTSGWFWKVRACLLVCFGMITLHCIVLVAILFPEHPYIVSATALSDYTYKTNYMYRDTKEKCYAIM